MPAALPENQAARIRRLMQSGAFADKAAVIDAALDLLERRQTLHALVQEGIDAADRGEIVDHQTVFGKARPIVGEAESRRNVTASR